MKTLEVLNDKQRCFWCGKPSANPLTVALQVWKEQCTASACSEEHEQAMRKAYRYVQKMFPVFLIGMLSGLILVMTGQGGVRMWLGLFLLGTTVMICPFVTPQTVEFLGLKKAFIFGRVAGTTLCITTIVLATILGNFGCSKNPAEVKAEQEATKVALAWLDLIDSEKYAESWEQSAAPFKNSLTAEKWAAMVSPLRKPMGKLLSRKTANQEYMTSLPGGPTGEFVVIQFKTDFENKKGAIETVTPMVENGQWKVSGYYIK